MISKPKITHVRPKKRLGQHFLRRKEIAQKIVDALEVGAEDTLIEVGAGTGELTRLIVKKAGKVVAVEVDETCFPTLQVLADLNKNLELFLDDIRGLDLSHYGCVTGVLGNLPYHLSAEILFWLLDQRDYWKKAVLTVQAEFADRLVAEVGSHDYSALSVVFQTFLEVEKLFDIPSSAFVPPPKVKSTTIRIKPLEGVELPVSEDRFIKFVRACFTHRRKRLANNLKIMGIPSPDKLLGKLGHSPTVRPQELSSHDYIELTGSLA
ncbi:ribosomal RNA small subunit methyltransferase A [candidate division WOR-3 bacterium]|nr:ribosomal RNA small subunit methyltransferase A [candidate division WOR-3 bacterium]MCK4334822.1 ribosomal RNA small subunit methyltransferase A [candidate division WOR-3 bacterium]